MDVIRWKDSYNLGITRIDEQHKKLVEILNTLYNAMAEKQTKEKLATIISELKSYTIFHFTSEENMLQSYGYPELPGHKKIHITFVDKIEEYRKRQAAGDTSLSVELVVFLKDWLIKHIQGTDQKYALHLKAKGIILK